MRAVGWIACLALAASLIYGFVDALVRGPQEVDPVFFSMQSTASALFLAYSIRLRNAVFITANTVALLSALGTVVVGMLG